MKITIRITAALANRFTEKNKVITHEIDNEAKLLALLEDLNMRFPGLKKALISKEGDIADSINIYVNGDNIRYLEGVNTEMHDGDVLNIIPAAAAG